MEEIYANVDYVKPVGLRPSTNQTSRSGSDRRFLGAVVLLLGLLSFVLLAGLIGLGVHHRDSAAEHLAVRENLTERLQASENKTSSLSREIERLQTLSNRVKTCPDGWKRFECTCYLVSVETASWERGWQDCTSRGADLVIVDRAEEQLTCCSHGLQIKMDDMTVPQKMKPEHLDRPLVAGLQTFLTKIAKKDTWIGLMDRDQEGSWKWSDGTPLTLAFWWTGQPDNGGGHPKYGEEDCAVITANMGTDKNWNDLRCDASRPWICEKNAN
ncbi:putative CD209 antigen-like protein E [Scophthalmus maximus]|uniref:Putative CD209 antigen-like protein E n=1 Tax=Scophthalmus maximus TaxID=52904 RepID=A0A2U9CFC6_SCOMX|nr:putative CD209 antigen-like protein E [Scophthalmus maximus]